MAELGALSLRIEAIGDKQVLQALNAIETKAKALDKTATDAAAALKTIGIAARVIGSQVVVASGEVERATAIVQKMGLTARVVSKEQVEAAKLEANANRVRHRGFQDYLAILSQGARLEGTRADAIKQLIALEAALQKQLQQTNLTFQQKVRLGETLGRVQVAMSQGIETTTQATRQAVAVQQTQANGLQVLGRGLVDANGKVSAFGRSGFTAFNALAFGASQLAAQGTASFRSLSTAMASVLSFFGPQGAIAAGVIATGLVFADFFARTKKGAKETADAMRGLVEAGNARFAKENPLLVAQLAEAKQLAEVRRIEADIAKKNAQIQKPGAGLAVAGLIGERTTLEADLKTANFALIEAQRKVADAFKDAGESAREAGDAEVAALVKVLEAGRATDNERRQAGIVLAKSRLELDLLNKANRLDADSAIRRAELLERIQSIEEAMLAPMQRRRQAIADEITQLASLGQTRGLAGIELVRLAVLERELTAELRAGHPTKAREAEIWDQITKARTAAARSLPPAQIRELVSDRPQAANQLAIPPSVAAFLDPARIRADIEAADRRIAERTAALNFDETQAALSDSLGNAIAASIASGFAQGLGEGGIGQGFKQMAAQLSTGLGSVAIDYGLKAQAIAKFMAGISKFLIANPLVAIGLGIGLVALGRALGGGQGSGGNYGGSFGGSTTSTTPLSVSRLIVDPNAGVRQRVAASAGRFASPAAAPDLRPIEVIGINTAQGQRLIGTANDSFNRRRG